MTTHEECPAEDRFRSIEKKLDDHEARLKGIEATLHKQYISIQLQLTTIISMLKGEV